MCDSGDTLPLLHRGGTQQRAGRRKQNVLQPPLPHLPEYMRRQYRRTASRAGSARVDIRRFFKHQHAAIIVAIADIDALLRQKLNKQLRPDLSEIAGKYRVKIADLTLRPLQIPIDGVRRRRC